MNYDKKPKMILFDVGGTLFDDGKCVAINGLAQLRLVAENPDVTDDATLASLWEEYLDEVDVGLKSKSGVRLDIPLSAMIKYVTMRSGLRFGISMARQEEFFDRYNSERKVIDGVEELLDELESLGIRTAVISNNAMSGDGLALALKRWLPTSNFEFCLTSADLLLTKPCKSLFECAAAYASVEPSACWYCGDSRGADVDGAVNGAMSPVLLDVAAEKPLEMRTDGGCNYLTVRSWDELKKYLMNIPKGD